MRTGRGCKNPTAQEAKDVVAPFTSTWLLRQPLDPVGPLRQDASGVAQFTPLRQLRPPEVSPLVSYGRLDTGTSALEGTAVLDFEVDGRNLIAVFCSLEVWPTLSAKAPTSEDPVPVTQLRPAGVRGWLKSQPQGPPCWRPTSSLPHSATATTSLWSTRRS